MKRQRTQSVNITQGAEVLSIMGVIRDLSRTPTVSTL
jgi:hypothetical protein